MRVAILFSLALLLLSGASSCPAASTGEPEVVCKAPQNAAALVTEPGGDITCYFVNRSENRMMSRRSANDGRTWSPPAEEFDTGPTHNAVFALKTKEDTTHIFYLSRRYVDDGRPRKINRNSFLDVLHRKRRRTGEWSEPRPAFRGYCGALLGGLQMDNGRLLLPLGMWKAPGEGLPGGGQNSVGVVYSDDGGATWQQAPVRLTAPVYKGYNGNNYGACEPSIGQLSDGRLWMLFRTQTGFLYQSFSRDGLRWGEAEPSRFHSSNSPAAMLRLRDGRIMVLWNNVQQPPRHVGGNRNGLVYGGRDALHAAVARGDGTRWRGFREVFLDPYRHEPPPRMGDRGTAYPCAVEAGDGMIVVTSGQHRSRRIFRFDPAWLTATTRRDGFQDGLATWTAFRHIGPVGEAVWRNREPGAAVADHAGAANGRALHLRRVKERPGDGAVWNFPLGTAGEIAIRLLRAKGCGGGEIALLDRFVNPADDTAGDMPRRAIWRVSLRDIDGLTPDRWHNLRLEWDLGSRACRLLLDNAPVASLDGRQPSKRHHAQPPRSWTIPNGICYLLLRSTAEGPDPHGWYVDCVSARVTDSVALESPIEP